MESGPAVNTTTKVPCPYCGRTISTRDNRWAVHGITYDSTDYCPLSQQPVPITGTEPRDFVRRANIVTSLAFQLQDEDPHLIWNYLTATPAAELQRLLMVALAAIDTNKTMSDLYGWVYDLPAANKGVAA